MTVVTAAAAAALGLVLATLARTRAQLSGLLDDPHPDDVGARRQHVSALPDERDDAEDRAADVQRVGARRVSEGVLARGRRSGSCGRRCWCSCGLTVVFLAAARMLARAGRRPSRSRGAAARDLFLQIDAETLGHPVERPAIDPEDFGRARAIAPDLFDDVQRGSAARARRATADRQTAARAGRARCALNGRSATSIDRAAAEDHEPLDRVLELADVARPAIRGERRDRGRRELDAASGARARVLQEGLDQQRECLRAVRAAPARGSRSRSAGRTGPAGSAVRDTSRSRSTLVAATTRTSTLTMRLPPTGRTSPSCSTRSSLTCSAGRRLADLVEEHGAAVWPARRSPSCRRWRR